MNDLLWLFVYDDSPVFVERIKGWNGVTPNPSCFNCEHTLARHENLSHGWSRARQDGAEGTCTHPGCSCCSYYPSHTVPLEDSFSGPVIGTELKPVGVDNKGNYVYVDSQTGYHYANGTPFIGELTVQMQGKDVNKINVK